MQENLRRMVRLSVAAGARVLLLGMRIPPNYGPEYTDNFANSFARVAKLEGIPLVPFLLADVALSPALMQADGVHANEQGQPKLLGQVWPALKPMLRK
jgi:acyl-CoA thioesterase-1